MEGISTIIVREKKIYVVDFTHCGKSKEETLKLFGAVEDEFEKNPLNSVLALVDVAHAFFHFDTLKTFKNFQERCSQYQKKVAVIGLKGLQKTGFNSVVGSNKKGLTKAFDSEMEAKEWLVAE